MSLCRGCGKEIIWGVTAEGKRIPLDPRPPVYRLVVGYATQEIVVERQKDAMVSHFATCSRANDFSASKRKQNQ
jgi:hypothetical protein